MTHHEIATLRYPPSGGAIEIRQDRAHRISTITHLREMGITQQCDVGEQLSHACFESSSKQDACLQQLFFSLAKDQDILYLLTESKRVELQQPVRDEWLLLGSSHRRHLGSTLSTWVLERYKKARLESYRSSCNIRLKALQCVLMERDEHNKNALLHWLLQESPAVLSEDDPVDFSHIATTHNNEVKDLLLDHGLDTDPWLSMNASGGRGKDWKN